MATPYEKYLNMLAMKKSTTSGNNTNSNASFVSNQSFVATSREAAHTVQNSHHKASN